MSLEVIIQEVNFLVAEQLAVSFLVVELTKVNSPVVVQLADSFPEVLEVHQQVAHKELVAQVVMNVNHSVLRAVVRKVPKVFHQPQADEVAVKPASLREKEVFHSLVHSQAILVEEVRIKPVEAVVLDHFLRLHRAENLNQIHRVVLFQADLLLVEHRAEVHHLEVIQAVLAAGSHPDHFLPRVLVEDKVGVVVA